MGGSPFHLGIILRIRYVLLLINIFLGISAVGCHHLHWARLDDVNYSERLVDTLETANYNIDDLGRISQPIFSAEGSQIQVSGENLQIFEFPSVSSALQATRQTSGDGLTIDGQPFQWVSTPHFYHEGRFIVLYIGDDFDLITLLESVFGVQFAGGISYPDI